MAHRLAARGAADLEALSPRDANAQRMPKPSTKPADGVGAGKTKTAAQLKAAKDKEHPPPPPPEVLEPASAERPDGAVYQTGKLLGKGGFAICYTGHLQPTNKVYALKIVKSHMPAKMEQKFQTELQIHSKMKHKNIVQFWRAFSFHNSTYLVLELCPNGSLMDMVKRRKGLTEPEVRFYSVQIAGAIKYMHSKGIIHRDLKMGNIFLDAHMNAKIGDFGLAALLVTGRDMHTIRRTTLCGTPNYIAPEILEKGKKGHDHMVDIWSLGIIMFAMFTSKPPFQSSTTDEIYRRARERDYEWPVNDATRYISDEAKDLVAIMLENADQRPEPDAIIQHPFFTIGYTPRESEMSSRLRDTAPDRQEFYGRMPSAMRTQALRNFKELCRECCIGPMANVQLVHTQIWKEMAAEEKAGLTPIIPLAEDIVYTPFDDWIKEQQQLRLRQSASAPPTVAPTAPPEKTSLLRQPPQSFAAQQRAQNRPAAAPPAKSISTEPLSQSTRTRSRADSLALRPKEAPDSIRSVRPAVRTALPSIRSAPNIHAVERSATLSTSASVSLGHSRQNSNSIHTATLFGPLEKPSQVAGTNPDVVLERLRKLETELDRALNARSMAIVSSRTVTPSPPHIVVKWVDYTNKFGLGYILNDGSVGCILRDIPTTEGSKTALLPSAGVFIRGAERHILRRQDESYLDRNQPVPMSQLITFFENKGEAGVTEVSLSPEQFRVATNEDGTPGKMNPGRDVYSHRKRERIILWKKFANYMIAHGRDEAIAEEPVPRSQKATPSELVTFYQRFGDVGCWAFGDGHLQFNFPDHTKIVLDATGTWCHFWHLPQDAAERLAETGTIGAAALDDRAILSYPLQTLLNFQSRTTANSNLATRSSTRRRPEIDPALQGIPAANDFRRKIEFVRTVVHEWVANGGLGNSSMARDDRLRWRGHREVITHGVGVVLPPQKHVWVTIGSRWGDQRISTLVDPLKPWELGDEVEAKK
ncbi:Serine/threonine-protein kinase [Cordyceps fumosorosea ARSEF 2679]|uniref:Serine/threonine-protein kinase n=1 Tax=Cordyceps fumosorosea (strain ARSEF 2679) TaxID=1081104 RepID=A0A167WLP6_CORFA|nr:Serine/threonine-protein kinase [Cordyceps fumosorosea ARSEF 2679]OAA63946.1 Serine/threonine-protein kinase [Cordyceps fumosorosea ARSEF 2679]